MTNLTTSFSNYNYNSQVLYGFITEQSNQVDSILSGGSYQTTATANTTNSTLTGIFGELNTAISNNVSYDIDLTTNGSLDVTSLTSLLSQIFCSQVDPQEQENIEKRNAISEKLNQIAELRDQMLSGEVTADAQRLQAMNQLEKALVEQLKATYPEDSAQAKALDTTLQSMQLDQKEQAIKTQMSNIETQMVQLLAANQNVDPNSSEAQVLQARLEAMAQIQTALLQELENTKEEQKEVNSTLTSDLMACPRADRQLIGDIKRDQMHSGAVLHQTRVSELSEVATAIKEYLEQDGISDEVKTSLEMRLQLVTQQLKTEKFELMKASFGEFLMNVLMF